jgi:hypothetical protein
MEQEPRPPRNTKELVAGWQNIVEEHVVRDLAGALHRLAADAAGGTDFLARHVAHALQLAANPSGGIQAAVQYLCEVADRATDRGPA